MSETSSDPNSMIVAFSKALKGIVYAITANFHLYKNFIQNNIKLTKFLVTLVTFL